MKQLMLVALALAILAAAPPPRPLLRLRAVLRGHPNSPRSCAFSPDGKLLAVCNEGSEANPRERCGEIRLWDVRTGKLAAAWRVDAGYPTGVVFSQDGKTLFSLTETGGRICWDVARGVKKHVFPPTSRGVTFSWGFIVSSDGKRIGAGTHKRMTVWDSQEGDKIAECTWKTLTRGFLSHDLRLVAVTNYQDVDLRDMRTGKIVRSLMDHPGSVGSLSFSGDDRVLAVSYRWRVKFDAGTSVRLWDLKRGAVLRTIKIPELNSADIALSRAGDVLAVTGSIDDREMAELRVYDTTTGGELARLRPVPPGERISGLKFSPDGKMLALRGIDGSDGTLALVEVRRAKKSR